MTVPNGVSDQYIRSVSYTPARDTYPRDDMPRKPASKPEQEIPEDEILDQDDDGSTDDDDDEDDDGLTDDEVDGKADDDEDGSGDDEEDGLGEEEDEPAPPAILARLKELGYEDEFEDENAALDAVFGGLSQLQQQAALYQQQAEQYQRYLAELQQGQRPQQSPAQEQEPQSYWPKAPEWKPEYETMLTRDENGRVVIRPEFQGAADPNLPAKFHEYQRWQQERVQALISDPVEATWAGYQPRVEELLNRALEERFGRHDQQEAIRNYLDTNKHRFYQLDDLGRIQRTQTGEEALTEEGEIYRNALYYLNSQQYPKHLLADAAELITQNTMLQKQLQSKTRKKSTKKKSADQKEDFYRKHSTRKPNTNGSRKRKIPSGANLDLEKMLKQNLKDYPDEDFQDDD